MSGQLLKERARKKVETPVGIRDIYCLHAAGDLGDIDTLPYCMKVLLEAGIRLCDGRQGTEEDVACLAGWTPESAGSREISFMPGRVVLQDFTGVPAMVDLAAMRDAIVELTGNEEDASRINPLVPCDLVIDHSVQVDAFGDGAALSINSSREFERNGERYAFLKWGQEAFDNFRVIPPATGIVHQVNLEHLARVIWDTGEDLYPDSLVGTDSHTTMINGLGVVGWGVGGIEAEAVMLGQPVSMLLPEVLGLRLTGALPEGSTATDLVLRVTELLRAHGVVGTFVEFFGPGITDMPVAHRATIANMAPEYGATMGYFPIDAQVMRYLALSGREPGHIEAVEQYCRLQGMWHDDTCTPRYGEVLELDMGTVVASLAGPSRPQDRVELSSMKSSWKVSLAEMTGSPPDANGRAATASAAADEGVEVQVEDACFTLSHGAVCIAAITSCTNTSNPSVMIAAGLVARNARRRGLEQKPWVKTSLAPGSKVVTEYLQQAGLLADLEELGFHVVGYGCTTCIGNSGPLAGPISEAIHDRGLVVASVLSGNRNFEGRINPDIRASYLASPPLVVAYALAGTVDIDLTLEPLGDDASGTPVYLKDIWPTQSEIESTIDGAVTREQFVEQYARVLEGSDEWREIEVTGSSRFAWDDRSTYIQQPPFFSDMSMECDATGPIRGARVLCLLEDSITTDHISPAGFIGSDTPAGKFLMDAGVPKSLFNSYGSRRGNDRVMTRGTFANLRLRNLLADGMEGGFTRNFLSGEIEAIHDAAAQYRENGVPLVVIAGREYGMGSSRDWAAKGTALLGVRAVIASGFERIHRSNLVGMGVLPLEFVGGQTHQEIGIDGTETFDILLEQDIEAGQRIALEARREDGSVVTIETICRIDTPVEIEYFRNGGILHTVLRRIARDAMTSRD